MTDKILRKFIRETVIDARDKFRKKRNIPTKLTNLADDLPTDFKNQNEQEAYVNKRLKNVEEKAGIMLGNKRFLLACPACYEDQNGWRRDTSPYTVISFASKYLNKKDWLQISSFVKNNSTACKQTVEFVQKELKDIAAEAEQMKWSAPWERYTRWTAAVYEADKFISNINSLLK